MLSTAIALLAAAIAYGQWYTARQKLILDLFEKRAERYKALRAATGLVIANARIEASARSAFDRAVFDMEYLFGRDVIAHLEESQELLKNIASAERGPNISEQSAKELADLDSKFQSRMKDLYSLILPYIQMQQKLPMPPWRWPLAIWDAAYKAYINRPTGE